MIYIDGSKWKRVDNCTGDVPTKRSGMQGIAFDQEILFFGGCSKYMKDYHNETYLFNPISLNWRTVRCKYSPPPRIDFSLSNISNRRCLMFGGLESYLSYSDTYIFDMSTNI